MTFPKLVALSGPMTHSMDLEGIPLKIKYKLFHLIPSTSKKGIGCLLCLFGF